jgi:hypothetical protein
MGHNLQALGSASLDTMGGLCTFADARDLPEGASPRNWDVDFNVGSVYTRPGLLSMFSYASTIAITGVSLVYGTATFTYVGAEPTVNEGFLLSGFTGVLSFLNGLTVYVEYATMTTFTALVTGSDVTQYNITGYAVSNTGQFVGPKQGTVATSSTWVSPLNIFSPTAFASATTGNSITDSLAPTSAANLSSSNPAWTNPGNSVAVGASVASVALTLGGAPPPPPPPPPPAGTVPVQMIIGGFGAGSTSATTNPKGFASATAVGNFLVCVVWSDTDTSAPPTISLPVTSGFTWVLAGSSTYSHSTIEYGRVSVYYIANAASMPTTTKTTVTATRAGASSTEVEFALYEWSGIVTASVIDTFALGSQSAGALTLVNTASLVTSVKDLIFVSEITSSFTLPTLGAGYTTGISSFDVASGSSQYIPNQAAGTVSTAFGSSKNYWACIALAFKAA